MPIGLGTRSDHSLRTHFAWRRVAWPALKSLSPAFMWMIPVSWSDLELAPSLSWILLQAKWPEIESIQYVQYHQAPKHNKKGPLIEQYWPWGTGEKNDFSKERLRYLENNNKKYRVSNIRKYMERNKNIVEEEKEEGGRGGEEGEERKEGGRWGDMYTLDMYYYHYPGAN